MNADEGLSWTEGGARARHSKQLATAMVPGTHADQRTARGLCVCLHGAGSYPSIFDTWSGSLPDWEVIAPDLQAGLDLFTASMKDYADAANKAAVRSSSDSRVVVCGWSMGGLVALMAAPRIRPAALILLEPSLPAEIAGTHDDVPLGDGTYDPAELYGRWPDDPPTRPESNLALSERQRGVSVPSVGCPLLVIASATYADTRGFPVADHYGGELALFPHLHHVSLVQNAEVRTAIGNWLIRLFGD